MDQNENKLPNTHAISKPNAKPPTEIEKFKSQLVGDYQKQVTNYFMGDKDKAMKFMSAVVYSVQKTPKLLECDKESLMQSFMTCAEYGFYPSNASGEAYVLPSKGKAQFQLGYQGLVTLMFGAGVSAIHADVIRSNDKYTYENGVLNHTIDLIKTKAERGQIIAAYASAIVNGEKIYSVMNIQDIMAHGKKFSKSFDSEYSSWKTANDPESWMPKKTVLKQLGKLMPKNEKLFKALEADNDGDSTLPKLDAFGPATGKPNHGPTIIPVNELGNE